MKFISLLSFVALVSACSTQSIEPQNISIDMRPVGCDYKWFQGGISPPLSQSCDLPRGEILKTEQTKLATANAWEIARTRCPAACPPIELNDPTVWEEPFPNGSCRENRVYYTARVFFQCASR